MGMQQNEPLPASPSDRFFYPLSIPAIPNEKRIFFRMVKREFKKLSLTGYQPLTTAPLRSGLDKGTAIENSGLFF